MRRPSDKWVKVHTIESIFEMDMIKDALDKEGFAYTIKEHKDTAYDGLFILQKGYATLFVEERDEKKVQTIVKRIKSLPYVAYSKD
jgi:ketol-acid reductoisomerase